MYRFLQCFYTAIAATLLASVSAHAVIVPTYLEDSARDYDEQVVQLNAVDVTAPGSINLATFTSDVATAWDNDLGGVIQFSVPTDDFGAQQVETIKATYGVSHTKTIEIHNGDNSRWDTANQNKSGQLSDLTEDGNGAVIAWGKIRKDCGAGVCTNDYVFDIVSVNAGAEVVTSIGVTAMGRAGSLLELEVYAEFDDGSVSASMFDDIQEMPGVLGTDDTFFGVTAPAGRHITKFVVANGPLNNLSGGFGHLDDLAFVTSAVPEPSSFVLAFGSLVASAMFSRRKR